jgi:hypothetical protein
MARIVGHLPIEELEERYRAAEAVAEARHHQAIWPLAQGRTFLEVAEVLAFVPRRVTRLARRHDAFGPSALGDRRRRNGRAASLPTEDVPAALAERVEAPPEDGGVLERPQGRPPDGAAARPGEGAPAARPGGAGADRLVDPGAAAAACARGHARAARGHARAAGGLQGGLEAAVARARAAHPDRPVEVWAADGWTHCVRPASARSRSAAGSGRRSAGGRSPSATTATAGRTSSPSCGRPAARRSGSSRPACRSPSSRRCSPPSPGRPAPGASGTSSSCPTTPAGTGRRASPSPRGSASSSCRPTARSRSRPSTSGRWSTSQPQPAEHLWPLVDEPIVDRHFATLADLEAVVAERCRRLEAAAIKPHTDFHWWPRPTIPN